jgi:hypothetical protein
MSVEKELKARLAVELCAIVDDRTVVEAAASLSNWPSEMSALRRGRYRGFSIDRLVRMIVSQRYDIELSLRPIVFKPAPRVEATIAVVRYDRYGRAQPAPNEADAADPQTRDVPFNKRGGIRDL